MLLFDYLRGICVFEVYSPNIEVFINAVRDNAAIKNLKLLEGGKIRFCCFYGQRKYVESRAEETGGIARIIKARGLPLLFERALHRPGLIAGAVLTVLAIMLSSLFVWEIRVEGNENISDAEIIKMLDEVGFCEGMIKKTVNVKRITDRVLINEDAVSWMAINFDGTVAHVEVREAMLENPYPRKQNVNIVASANGMILRVDALDGTSVVAKGDPVVKGQLLVSAFVDKRTGGSLLRGARGFVWAKTERKIGVTVPLEYKKKITAKTGVINELSLTFIGKKLVLKLPFVKSPRLFTVASKQIRPTFSENKALPLVIEQTEKLGYTEYTAKRTQKDALAIARETSQKRLYEISPGFVPVSKKEEYRVDGTNFVYYCSFEGVENIAKELEFELS